MATSSEAFLSYTRIDDEFFGGAITSLRKLLEQGVQVVSGDRNFKIFQDVDGIEFGENWQKRLDEALISTRFLIRYSHLCISRVTHVAVSWANLSSTKELLCEKI
jgi:hypothetical protein